MPRDHACPGCGRAWKCALPMCLRSLVALCPPCQEQHTDKGVVDHPEHFRQENVIRL
jgi:hypothetical protein